MKNLVAYFFRSFLKRFRLPPRSPGEPSHFRELLSEVLADPEMARWAARRRLLPLFPLQGGACDYFAGDIGPGNFGACQAGDYTFSTGSVGIGTTVPTAKLEVRGNSFPTVRIHDDGTLKTATIDLA